MNRARVMMLGVALVAAAGAAMVAKNAVRPPVQTTIIKEIVEEEVLVASRNIGLGEQLTLNHLRWEPWPRKMTLGYITRKRNPGARQKYVGTVARTAIQRGEPISRSKLVSKGGGGVLAAILPSGMRAIAVPIKAESAAGGFILPNDRVDVILSRSSRRGRDTMVFSDTILRNVRVLAIGTMMENRRNKKNSGTGKSTATLELTPDQARTLAAAREQGNITLTLRSLADIRRGNRGPQSGSMRGMQDKQAREDRGGIIKYLKYGVPSQAMGL